jgi:hypothetical protein
VRTLPRGIAWGPAAERTEYGFHKARVPDFCHHRPEDGSSPLLGPCVRYVRAGEYYLSAEHGPRSRQSKIAFTCAVYSGLLLDTRLTPPLIETLLCAEHEILMWFPGTGPGQDVWISGDDGTARFNEVAQDAANWLQRNGFAVIEEMYIVPTVKGHEELAAWRHEQARRPLWQR